MYDLLVSGYKMFKMFRGPFKGISTEDIYTICDNFFTPVSFEYYMSDDSFLSLLAFQNNYIYVSS